MAITSTGKVTTTQFTNIGDGPKRLPAQTAGGAEFRFYDRARSSDAHVILDVDNRIKPIAYFEKFDAKCKDEILYRQPLGSKVPIGELKTGGWDLSFSNGLISPAFYEVYDVITKQRFDGRATPRLAIYQRITFNSSTDGKAGTAQDGTGGDVGVVAFIYFDTVLYNYSLATPGDGNPLEESCSGYARFRLIEKTV